jgi:hypothetical protein
VSGLLIALNSLNITLRTDWLQHVGRRRQALAGIQEDVTALIQCGMHRGAVQQIFDNPSFDRGKRVRRTDESTATQRLDLVRCSNHGKFLYFCALRPVRTSRPRASWQ